MYTVLPSYNGSEEGDESPASVLDRRLGYTCHINNNALNKILDNDSFQYTNG